MIFKYSSHSIHSIDYFLCGIEVFQFGVYYISIFCFVVCAFGVISIKLLPRSMSSFPSMFSSRSFIASGFMVKPLIHFDLIVVYGVR